MLLIVILHISILILFHLIGQQLCTCILYFCIKNENIMCDNNKKVFPGDNIFVCLTQNGKSLLNLYGNEFAGISEIVKFAYLKAKHCFGIATLNVRNQSQGWSYNIPLMLNKHNSYSSAITSSQTNNSANQRELPFVWA